MTTSPQAEDIEWWIVGRKRIQGKDAYEQELRTMSDSNVRQLTVHSIVTHGREAAANGTIETNDGTRFEFCDVYAFVGTKGNRLKKITSYMIAAD
ncbi:MAG: nuclear transport factor 2 family protein [Spirochaetota bacterium]